MSKNNPFLGYLSYKYVTEITKIGLFVLIHFYSVVNRIFKEEVVEGLTLEFLLQCLHFTPIHH